MPIHDWTRVDAGIFHDFHHEWISTIKQSLNAGLLPPDFYALAEQMAGGMIPDVLTLETVGGRRRSDGSGEADGDTVLALETAPPKVRFTFVSEPERYSSKQSHIAIRHKSGDEVVAVLEIVSPGNKGSRFAFRTFVEKALELVRGGIHLVVIDLFPPGPRDPQGIHGAIWSEIDECDFTPPADQPLSVASYSSGELKQAFVEPMAVGGALPPMPLFLDPRRYVTLPLEASYREAFAAVPRRWREELEP